MKWLKNIFYWLLGLFGLNTVEETAEASDGAVPEAETDTGSTVTVDTGTTVAEEPIVDTNTGHTETQQTMKEYKYVILLDNGHAKSTPGKRSPVLDDGRQFFEYEFNRDIVRRIAKRLDELGVPYEILVPEVEEDVYLTARANRANKFCSKYGTSRCIFISVHSNAAGNGSNWMTAKGFSCYTSKGETASDPIAELFMRKAEEVLVPMGYTIRKYSAKKYSWEDNFTVLVKTNCPAILTENMFYDNKKEVEFLLSDEGRDAIAEIHVRAIMELENQQ